MTHAIKPVILLDLDRMLFDSDRFKQDVAMVLSRRFGVDTKRFYDEYHKYDVYNGDMRHNGLFLQLQDYGLGVEEVQQAVKQDLQDQNYTYDDVADFVTFARQQADIIVVLTHGTYDYQYMKFQLAPPLRGLEFKDVLTHKREYIAERFRGQSGVLLDDHKVGTLPPGFEHIWVSRYEAPGAFHSLTAVREAWNTLWPPRTLAS